MEDRDTRLTVFIGDPLVTPVREPMRTGWRLPWTHLTDKLLDALYRTGRQWTVDVQPATVGRFGLAAPRSRFVAILCHGDRDGLAFENEEGTGVWHHLYAEDLGHFFRAAPPDVVLVLACRGAAAARAINRAGVPLTLGVDQAHELWWHEAVELTAVFFGALAAGHGVQGAVAQAVNVTPRGAAGPAPLRYFGAGRTPAPLPPGTVTAPRLDDWVSHPPSDVFVGRELALAQLLSDVSRPGIVHLFGPPGSGKTELARALLDRGRLARWPLGGSVFVSLDDVTTADGVCAAVALARPPTPRTAPGTTPDELGALLGAGERLVVLDNADDVLRSEAASSTLHAVLSGVLAARPTCRARVVVTSTGQLPWRLAAEPRVVSVSELDGDAEAKRLLEAHTGERETFRVQVVNDGGARATDVRVVLDDCTPVHAATMQVSPSAVSGDRQ